MKMKGTDNA